MNPSSNDNRAWYREPMVWLMLALPAAAVVAGLSTVAIAVRASGNDAVPESVRRTAQIQIADLAADRQAAQRRLRAFVYVTRDTGAVRVSVTGNTVTDARLQLRFIHATDGSQDAHATLVRTGDAWLGRIDAPIDRAWAVVLSAEDDNWRLQGSLPPGQDRVLLEPALASE